MQSWVQIKLGLSYVRNVLFCSFWIVKNRTKTSFKILTISLVSSDVIIILYFFTTTSGIRFFFQIHFGSGLHIVFTVNVCVPRPIMVDIIYICFIRYFYLFYRILNYSSRAVCKSFLVTFRYLFYFLTMTSKHYMLFIIQTGCTFYST